MQRSKHLSSAPTFARALFALLLAFVCSAPLAQTQELWDESYRQADPKGSFELHAKRLAEGLAPDDLPSFGLPAEKARELHQELELRFLDDVAVRVQDSPRALETLNRFLAREHTPWITTLARFSRARYLWRTGDFETARKEWDQLGFVHDWWIVGPFDNERGSGFSVIFPPEEQTEWNSAEVYSGKRDDVTWRSWAEPGLGGALELGELLRPNEEALAYLVTHVHASQAQSIDLRVGSTGAYAIWIDGTPIARRDLERSSGFDQDVHSVELSAGWHRVLVKSGHTKGPWRFRMRLTHRDGTSALPLRAADTNPLELPLSVQGEPPAAGITGTARVASDAQPVLGARATLAKLAPTPESLRLLAFVQGDIGAFDRNVHPDRTTLLAALDAQPDAAITHYLLARTFQQDITHSAEREENRWRTSLERALALDPSFHEVRRQLARYHLDRFSNLTRAEKLLEPALARTPWPEGIVTQLEQIRRGRHGSIAAKSLQTDRLSVLANEPRIRLRTRVAREWLAQGRVEPAMDLIRRGLEFRATDRGLHRLLTQTLIRQGHLEEARSVFELRTRAAPHRSAPWLELADFETSCEDWGAALRALERAILLAPHEEAYREKKGQLLILAGRAEAGLEELRFALSLDPNQPRLREFIAHLEESEEDEDEEYAYPIAKLIEAALDKPQTGDDAMRVLLDNQVVRISKDGTTRRYVQSLWQVGNDQGVRALDYHSVPYAQGEQWVKVITAQVHHADGTREEAPIRNREPRVRDGEYPVWSSAWVDLPPLRIGDVVELEYRIEDLRQSFFGDYFGDRVLFGGLEPRDLVRYTIVSPPGMELFFHAQGLDVSPTETQTDEAHTYQWEVRDMPRLDAEPGMPPLREAAPSLEVSTFRDWDAFATWYHHLIRKQFESSTAIRQKVEELTKNSTTDLEKIRAIYNFVVTDVRYIAWEFGVHGFLPYNASTIFTRRFGDCKDKATLICTMLDEVDIEAHPVLIYGSTSRHAENFTLPMIDHFNHCIAYVPGVGEGGLFLDGTAENHSADELPLMDRGAKVLIVTDDGGRVETVPWNRPEELSVTEAQTVKLDQDGDAELALESEPRGDFAVAVRSRYEIEGQRTRQLERSFGSLFPGARVKLVEMSDLDNLDEAVKFRVEVDLPNYFDVSREGIKLPPLRDFFGTSGAFTGRATQAERKFDLLLGNPSRSELEVEITLPPGYEVSHMPEAVNLRSPYGVYTLTGSTEGSKIKLQRVVEVSAPRVPASDYSTFKEFADDVEDSRAERILLRKIKEVE